MDRPDLLRLRKIVSDIKGYAELYEDLYRAPIESRSSLEIVRLKMEHCREQVLKLSLEMNALSETRSNQSAAVVGSMASLGRRMMQVVNEMINYEVEKEELLTRLEKAFVEYHSGKYSYFDYTKNIDAILKGKQKEEWLESYEGMISGLVDDVMKLNNNMFYSAHNISLHSRLRLNVPGQELQPIEEIPSVEESRPIYKEETNVIPQIEEIPETIPEIMEERIAELPEVVEEEKIESPAPSVPALEEPKPAVHPQEQRDVQDVEEERQVEELLSKLKSGEVKPTKSVMKWLINRLKKQKSDTQKTEKERMLDAAMLGEIEREEEGEQHPF